jgi:hypothetical protein
VCLYGSVSDIYYIEKNCGSDDDTMIASFVAFVGQFDTSFKNIRHEAW